MVETKCLVINTDGGSRGNPGPSACSFVVKQENNVIHEESEYLGYSTNNIAEYRAIVNAMTWLAGNKNFVKDFQNVIFYMDSELAVRQLNGQYKVKNKNLLKLFLKIKSLENFIPLKIKYSHVTRDINTRADYLLNKTLDENQN
jgi:ribonuclease HI